MSRRAFFILLLLPAGEVWAPAGPVLSGLNIGTVQEQLAGGRTANPKDNQ